MIPKIVIVGRPNVGKSSLLNMIAERRVSITDATPGVTRDRVTAYVDLFDENRKKTRCVELIDTGGHGIEDAQQLTVDVERQIAHGVAEASLILFVVDAQAGVLPLDEEVAKLLRSAGCTSAEMLGKAKPGAADTKPGADETVDAKPTADDTGNGKPRKRKLPGAGAPVMLVANKVDGDSHEPAAHEAARLGFGPPIPVSAVNRYNRRLFLDQICDVLAKLPRPVRTAVGPDDEPIHDSGDDGDSRAPDAGVLIAIIGKRNAGKSTLVNALAGEQRVIVSAIEGTTRDAIDVRFEINGRTFTAIDTAGVRKRKSLAGDVEYYSYHRALRSVRRADVVLFLVDATVPISQVDKQLGLEVQKHHKPCVIVINKWDLVDDEKQEEFIEYLDKALQGLNYAPLVFISAKEGEGVRDVVAMALNLYEQSGARVGTGVLNRLFERLYEQHTPRMKHGRRPKIFYATQVDIHPPTISLFVNEPDLFDNSYERYLLNKLRDELPFSEVPIKLVFRGRTQKPQETAGRA